MPGAWGRVADLHPLAVRTDYRGMQRLVAVGLGHGDIILEAARDRLPKGMDDAQRLVAVFDLSQNNAEGDEVKDLLEFQVLGPHLPVDAVEVLRPAADPPRQPVGGQLFGDDRADFLNVLLPLFFFPGDGVGELLVFLRVEVSQGEVFQFRLDAVDSQPAGDRGVDIQGLLGNFDLVFLRQILEGAHVVEPVGQLDDDDADVLGHGQEHLPEVLGLLLLVGGQGHLADLGKTVHQRGDLRTEEVADLLRSGESIFHRVVEEARRNGGDVHLHLRQDGGDFQRVDQIGLSGEADLS